MTFLKYLKYLFCLQIVGVDVSDEGVYTCFADNGRGVPPQAQVPVNLLHKSFYRINTIYSKPNLLQFLSLQKPLSVELL